MIQVHTVIFTSRHRKKQVYVHDTVPFKIITNFQYLFNRCSIKYTDPPSPRNDEISNDRQFT